MKRLLKVFSFGLLLLVARGAGLEILGLSPPGRLSWSNSLPDAFYRLEWKGSVADAWRRIPPLLSLEAVAATGSVLTVEVPMFYRVVAETNRAARFEGQWQYRGLDPEGNLAVVGWLALEPTVDGAVTGRWTLGYAGDAGTAGAPGALGPQIGQGEARGGPAGAGLWLDLNPGWADNNVVLQGTLVSNRLAGDWSWIGFGGPMNTGRFEALRVWAAP